MAYSDTQPFQQAANYYSQAASQASPSLESLDRASARLRARTDTARRASDAQVSDSYAGRGQTYSGSRDGAMERNRAASMGAYSSGLAQLESDYADKQQKGAEILTGIGAGTGTLGYQGGQLDLEQQKNATDREIGLGQLDVNRGQLDLDKKAKLAEQLNQFFGLMGAYGNTQGSNAFNSQFSWAKQSLFDLFGLGPGEPEPYPNWDYRG